MNVALTSIADVDIDHYIYCLNPRLVLKSNQSRLDFKLADIALQLDEKIHFEEVQIDLICVINQTDINKESIDNFDTDYISRIYYTANNLYTSSFYCRPDVFSLIGSLYKIDYDRYDFKNLEQDTLELFTEKIFYIANRLGIEIKYA